MRNKMNKLASKLENMYLTENPVNHDGRNDGYKYFLCFDNTHTVLVRTTSIKDMVDEINYILENGIQVGVNFK